ncbi:hypothetical protein FQA39_LY07549 [Lamprigera yunnana]|nr:hypothetical protein FQA39_LY07549 [Lamprigera yunnana]
MEAIFDVQITTRESKILPLHQAYALIIRFSNPSRPVEDLEVLAHSNVTIASIRRCTLRRIKPDLHCELELFINGEPLDMADDRKLLVQIPLRDITIISAKIIQYGIITRHVDTVTWRSAYIVILEICKLILMFVVQVLVRLTEDHTPAEIEEY